MKVFRESKGRCTEGRKEEDIDVGRELRRLMKTEIKEVKKSNRNDVTNSRKQQNT